MRRLTALALLLLLLTSGCAYAYANETAQRAVNMYDLYFRAADLTGLPGGDALLPETVVLSEEELRTPESAARALMERLLNGPSEEGLRNPIPSGTVLLSVQVDAARAVVDLSSAYRALSGVSLSLADYAITLTLTQIQEISTVSVTVRGQELVYRDRQTFSAREVLRSSNEDVVGTVDAVLYFPDETGTLTPEERTLELYEGETQVGAVTKALSNGPESKSLRAVLPDGFQVRAVWQEEGSCYVNLPSAVLDVLITEDTEALTQALDSMRDSLLSLEQVQEVRFLVDGEFADAYHQIPLTEP